jgi:hypothetical protein
MADDQQSAATLECAGAMLNVEQGVKRMMNMLFTLSLASVVKLIC